MWPLSGRASFHFTFVKMATVRFYLKELKTGRDASVLLRFTIDRANRFKLSTGEKIPSQYWDSKLQQAKTKYPDHLFFNQALTRIKSDLIQMYRDNKSSSIADLQEMARSLVKFGQATNSEDTNLIEGLNSIPTNTIMKAG